MKLGKTMNKKQFRIEKPSWFKRLKDFLADKPEIHCSRKYWHMVGQKCYRCRQIEP